MRILHPFANRVEGEAWMYAWCNRCLHDHGMHEESNPHSDDPTCPFILSVLLDHPAPLVWQPYAPDWYLHLPAAIRCAAFEPCGSCTQPVELRPPVYGE